MEEKIKQLINKHKSLGHRYDSYLMESQQQWREWSDLIPYIKWPSSWLVKAVPPFAGAMIRYHATLPDKIGCISVYLDCYDNLGCFGAPYWEVYPVDGETYRCGMEDTDSLLKAIKRGLKQLKE